MTAQSTDALAPTERELFEAFIADLTPGQQANIRESMERGESLTLRAFQAGRASCADGWVKVPKEPTREMLDAMRNAPAYGHPETATASNVDRYRAAIAAAPSLPAQASPQTQEKPK